MLGNSGGPRTAEIWSDPVFLMGSSTHFSAFDMTPFVIICINTVYCRSSSLRYFWTRRCPINLQNSLQSPFAANQPFHEDCAAPTILCLTAKPSTDLGLPRAALHQPENDKINPEFLKDNERENRWHSRANLKEEWFQTNHEFLSPAIKWFEHT